MTALLALLCQGTALAEDRNPDDTQVQGSPGAYAASLTGDPDHLVISIDASPEMNQGNWRFAAVVQAGAERFRWAQTLGAGPESGPPSFETTLPPQVLDYLEMTDYRYLIDLSVSLKAENDLGQTLGEVSAVDYVLAGSRGSVQVLPTREAMQIYPWGLTSPPGDELAAQLVLLGADSTQVRILAPLSGPRRHVEGPMLADREGRKTNPHIEPSPDDALETER